MEQNEGKLDRIIRLVLGIILIFIAFTIRSWPRVTLLILAVFLIGTALAGVCPVYKLFDLSTNKRRNHD